MRTRRAILGMSSSIVAKAVSNVGALFLMGYLTRHLDKTQFGVWSLLTQLVFIVGLLDMGLGGASLRNALARGDENPRELFLAAFWFRCLLYAPLLPLGFLSPAIFFLLIRAPFSLHVGGFFAYQETHRRAFFDALEVLLPAALMALTLRHSFYFAGFALVSIWAFFAFLRRRHWRFSYVSWRRALPLFREGFFFGVQNLLSVLLFSCQPYLIAKLLSTETVAYYAVTTKLFSLMIGLHFLILAPLWSAYTEAGASGDLLWMRRTLFSSQMLTLVLFGLAGLLLIFFHKPLILLWTGWTVNDPVFFGVMAIWSLIYALINCLAVLLNGVGRVKRQVAMMALSSLLFYVLAYLGPRHLTYVMSAQAVALVPLLISNIWDAKRHFLLSNLEI